MVELATPKATVLSASAPPPAVTTLPKLLSKAAVQPSLPAKIKVVPLAKSRATTASLKVAVARVLDSPSKKELPIPALLNAVV